MTRFRQHQESGIVALITVIFAAILFTIVVISMVTIIASQEHQASEADLSNRAYYAAESGLESALLQVKDSLNSSPSSLPANTSSCTLLNNPQLAKVNATACVTMSNRDASGKIAADNFYELPIGSRSVQTIKIFWYQVGSQNADTSDSSIYLPNTCTAPTTMPSQDAYYDGGGGTTLNRPPVLEVQSILYNPNATSLNTTSSGLTAEPNQLQFAETDFYPAYHSGNCIGQTFTEDDEFDYTNLTSSNPNSYNTQMTPVKCAQSVSQGYACEADITVANNGGSEPYYGRILLIRPLYGGTHFNIQAVDSTGSAINLPSTSETIDVTGTAGGTARRVYTSVDVTNGTAQLDYAIWSDTNICHDIEVRDSENGNPGPNNPASVGQCPI